VSALSQRSKANLQMETHIDGVDPVRGGVRVRWVEGGDRKAEKFYAVIIATPDGERLAGKPLRGHFHGYVNVLLAYRDQPRVKGAPDFDLVNGLYTDGPLNYIQLADRARSPYGLRILIPNAGRMLRWEESDVVAFCVEHLKPIIINADQLCASSVKAWKFGLPCGGNNRSFQKVGSRVYLAGDRFGRWPSMDAAVMSGKSAANTALEQLKRHG